MIGQLVASTTPFGSIRKAFFIPERLYQEVKNSSKFGVDSSKVNA